MIKFRQKKFSSDDNYNFHDKFRYLVARSTPRKMRDIYREQGYSPTFSFSHPFRNKDIRTKAYRSDEYLDRKKRQTELSIDNFKSMEGNITAIRKLRKESNIVPERNTLERSIRDTYNNNKTQLDMFDVIDGKLSKKDYIKRRKSRGCD